MQVEQDIQSLQQDLEEGFMKVENDVPALEYEPRARTAHYYENSSASTFVLRSSTSATKSSSQIASPVISRPTKQTQQRKNSDESKKMVIDDIPTPVSSSSITNVSKKLGLIHEEPLKSLVESQCPVCR